MEKKYRADWEELAILDEKWAIVTIPKNKFGRWDEADFFSSGRRTIDDMMKKVADRGFSLKFGSALDFGCGIGRLALPLSDLFDEVCGLDVSPTMIRQAEAMKLDGGRKIRFAVNSADNLACLGEKKFDLAISMFCLQHIADREEIIKMMGELVRVLVPGGILFIQLPSRASYSALKSAALKLRGRLYDLCVRRLALPRRFCYEKLKLAPYMHMNHFASNEVTKLLDPACDPVAVLDDDGIVTAYIARKKPS